MEDSDFDPFAPPPLAPTVGESLSHAWKQMWNQMGTLLILGILVAIISLPNVGMSWNLDMETLNPMLPFFLLPVFIGSTVYSLLILQPFNYGYQYSTMKAAREEQVEAGDLLEGFRNYGNVILSSILVGLLTIIGFIFLIVPGIIVACKLVFVPLLVVDKRMSAMEAIQTSWHMTEGHAFTVFALGFVSIFIVLGGALFFIVGIVPAMIWVQTAYGTLYNTISSSQIAGY